MSDNWIPIYSADDAMIVRGKLEAFGVPTLMLSDNPARLGLGLIPIGNDAIYVPPDRLDEAHEILGSTPAELEDADDPPDYRELVELIKLGTRIRVLAVLSLCGLPLLASLPGAYLGSRYLNAAAELKSRPKSYGWTIIAIGICVLAIPVGIWVIADWMR
jgi:hypothetical protein